MIPSDTTPSIEITPAIFSPTFEPPISDDSTIPSLPLNSLISTFPESELNDFLMEDNLESQNSHPDISISASYGGSLRVAILNSLKENEHIDSIPLNEIPNPKKPKNRRRSSSGTISENTKPKLTLTTLYSFSLWATSPSENNRDRSLIQDLPNDLLLQLICSYLTVSELSNLRSTCSNFWNTLSKYAYEKMIIPLCQGEYVASCEQIAMLNAKQYEYCGLSRPKWEHEHNGACQLCGFGELDVFDCYCYTCNVSYHRACLAESDIDPESLPFLCEECQSAQETPVIGFPILLPPRNAVPIGRVSVISKSTNEQQPDPQLLSMRCSLRVALRNSLLEFEQNEFHSAKSTKSHILRWWEHSERGHSLSFRVVGGFNSSNMTPSKGIYEFFSSPDSKWNYTPFTSLPSHIPTIHSNMAIVISPDCSDEETDKSYRVWAFPQLRDRSSLLLSPENSWKRDICFDLACVMKVPVTGDSCGDVPAPRVSSAFCYSTYLGAIVVHGGLTVTNKLLSSSLPEESVYQADDWTHSSAGTSYISTDTLYCVPIRENIYLSQSKQTETTSKMKTRLSHPPEKEVNSLTVNEWTDLTHLLDTSIGLPSPRHGHTLTEIGSKIWIFGGMGFDSTETNGTGSKSSKRRQLNDLYMLELEPLKLSPLKRLEWKMPSCRGTIPPRRAGHSALALGCQLLIYGGANGNSYLSDLYILHTPTITWSCVKLSPDPTVQLPSSTKKDDQTSWARIISKRIKPALLPVSSHQFIIFGGGKVCDFSAPTFGAIPTDCYLVNLTPTTPPATPTPDPSSMKHHKYKKSFNRRRK